jgi:hypothetical protein
MLQELLSRKDYYGWNESIVDKWVSVPYNECKIHFYNSEGKEVTYGEHKHWWFDLEHPLIDKTLILFIELPPLDYRDNSTNIPKVNILLKR